VAGRPRRGRSDHARVGIVIAPFTAAEIRALIIAIPEQCDDADAGYTPEERRAFDSALGKLIRMRDNDTKSAQHGRQE